MRKLIFAGSILTLALVGCSKGNESKTADGRCTDSYISDYNRVTNAAKDLTVKYASKETYYASIKNACTTFMSKHSGQSCRAMDPYSGAEKQASSSDIQLICDMAERESSSETSGIQSVPAPGTAPAADREILLHLPATRLSFTVQNSRDAQLLFSKDSPSYAMVAVNGDITPLGSFARSSATMGCMLTGSKDQLTPSFRHGDVIRALSISEVRSSYSSKMKSVSVSAILNGNDAIGILCISTGHRAIAVADVRAALRGILTVDVK